LLMRVGLVGPARVVRRALTVGASFALIGTPSLAIAAASPPSTPSVGSQLATVTACMCEYFGASVAVSGTTALIGEPGSSDGAGLVEVFTESSGKWKETGSLKGSDTESGDNFGTSLAMSGTTAVVGAPTRDGGGSIYVFRKSEGQWTQTAELVGSDTVAGDWFGASVALSSSTIVVGAPRYGDGTGRAYVFTSAGGDWGQAGELKAPGNPGDFGYSVAVSGDTALVGAPGTAGTGSAYVFKNVGGVWTHRSQLKVPGGNPRNYGNAVAISGKVAVVCAWLGNDAQSKTGAAYVFTEASGSWTEGQKLAATDSSGGDDMGSSVAITGMEIVVGGDLNWGSGGAAYVFSDSSGTWSLTGTVVPSGGLGSFFSNKSLAVSGSTVLAGAPGHGTDPGDAYVFTETAGTWAQTQYLSGSNSFAGDEFGSSLALSGPEAAVGAPGYDGGAGRAYLAVPDITGVYKPTLPLDAHGTTAGDHFGASVAVDGITALVGAPGHGGGGSAYVFEETTDVPFTKGTVRCLAGKLGPGGKFHTQECRSWLEVAELTAKGTATGDEFGEAVAVSGDTAVVGAPDHAGTGTAYVFSDSGGTWSQVAELTGKDTAAGDGFGAAVSLSGDIAVVGAPDHAGTGAAYVFKDSGGTWSVVTELSGSDKTAGDEFGASVSVSGDTAVVGAPDQAGTGAAYLFRGSNGSWSELAKLSGSSTAAGDEFGESVAVSASLAVVGAPLHNKSHTGVAFAFET
jgi:FG-GAP repeat